MYNALVYKFSQNKRLKTLLCETKDRYIVEQAEDDGFWGCGANNQGKIFLASC